MYNFIVNEAASSGAGMKTWHKVRNILTERKIPHVLHTPKSREDTVKLVRSLSHTSTKERTHIVVIGGDGTLNTVMQGIDDFNAISLSLIPAGSGNDFAKGVGISSNSMKALLHLLDSHEEAIIDYGEATYLDSSSSYQTKRFLISSGTGYDADVCEEVDRSPAKNFFNKLKIGKIIYLFIALKKIFSFKNYIKTHECDADVTFDGKEKVHIKNMFLTAVMNTPFQGGNIPFCPMADWTDGYFDVCAVGGMTTPMLLLCIVMIYFKKHFLFRQVNHHHCQKINIEMKKGRWLHTDGDPKCETTSITMECKSGLHFIK